MWTYIDHYSEGISGNKHLVRVNIEDGSRKESFFLEFNEPPSDEIVNEKVEGFLINKNEMEEIEE